MSTCKRKDILEIPVTKKLSRGARKRRNKRIKYEQTDNETSEQTDNETSYKPNIPDKAPIDLNIVFNALKV